MPERGARRLFWAPLLERNQNGGLYTPPGDDLRAFVEARLQDGAPECPGCGLILAQPDICPNCGAELESYVSSCRLCGQELFGIVED